MQCSQLSFALAAMLAVLGVFAPSTAVGAEPQVETFVLIVTNNGGGGLGRPDLQYADDDGAKYYEFFSLLAPEENVVLLTKFDRDTARLFPRLQRLVADPTHQNVVSAAGRLAIRTRRAMQQGKQVELYFVFAGHGDVDRGRGFVELQDASLGSDELRRYILEGIPSTRTHLIADSCNSYFLIHGRKPGGRRFATSEDAIRKLAAELPHVGVLLSTNAEAEVFEWSELQSGIFSHAVRSGLAGAADVDGDKQISYREMEAFIATAVADVPNPAYRPTVFARAPVGGAPLATVGTVRGVQVTVSADGPRRMVVRDRNGLPWVDAHREPQVPLSLLLPRGVVPAGWVEELERVGGHWRVTRRYPLPEVPAKAVLLAELTATEPGPVGRGPATSLARLFTRPFGPAALAAFEALAQTAVPSVYGIARRDQQRMELLLENIGDAEHRGRMLGTSGLVMVGLLTGGAGLWIAADDNRTEDEQTAGWGMAIGGGAIATVGVVGLFVPSSAERLRGRFTEALARGEDPAVVVARTERDLYELASDYRRVRMLQRWTGLGMLLGGGALLVANEFRDEPGTRDRYSLGMLAAAGGWSAFASRYPFPIEGLVSLWESDTASESAGPQLSLTPVPGGAVFGLGGSF